MSQVSVIVPIYNTEKYLERCLKSIIKQTMEDIEILCIDDCSPDNSVEIVKKFCDQDNRIKLISHKQNLGLGGARNTGIKEASADYISGVDSDDYIQFDMLEKLYEATNDHQVDIVACGYQKISAEGKASFIDKSRNLAIHNTNHNIDIFTLTTPNFWNKLWRKSLFIDNDIMFPEHLYYEDLATTPRILSKSRKINYIEGVYYNHVVRKKSIMRSCSDKHILDYFKVFNILKMHLLENDLYDHYKLNFEHMINVHLRYYANIVLKESGMKESELHPYLKHILLLKTSYLNYDTQLVKANSSQLLALLSGRSRI